MLKGSKALLAAIESGHPEPTNAAQAAELAKHTPGPWHQNGSVVWSSGTKDRGNIATCDLRVGTHINIDQNVANARLIAAAPDLLAACKRVRDDLDAGEHPGPFAAILDAAIAKAEGR